MPNSKVMGVPMSRKRREAIYALYEAGGTLEVLPGERCISRERQENLLHLGTMALAVMERDGIITREIQGKNTLKISLTPEWSTWASENEPPKRRGPYNRNTRRSGKRVATARIVNDALPPIGSQLTVFLVQQDPDGTYKIGLRNGAQSWLTVIEGHTERATARR